MPPNKPFYQNYENLSHIGHGASAEVFKVRHLELGYVRALKVLSHYIDSREDKAYRSFIKECRTLLKIGNYPHPNIVSLYNPDLIDNHAVVEMDYIKGRTLDEIVREKGFLPYEEVMRFIRDIVGALAYTHHDIYRVLMDPGEDDLQTDPNDGSKFIISQQKEAELIQKYGIAHNDLHSNNVMRRDDDGRYMLLDFGIAVQDGECVRSSGKDKGCPEFMAPEKFDSLDVTPRSDVFSLGVLIFQAMTGNPPFVPRRAKDGTITHDEKSVLLNKFRSAPRPAMEERRRQQYEASFPGAKYVRDYPQWLDAVVIKCMAPDPANRYADARELLDYIKECAQRDAVPDGTSIDQISSELQHERDENRRLSNEVTRLNEACSKLKDDQRREVSALKDEKSKLEDAMRRSSGGAYTANQIAELREKNNALQEEFTRTKRTDKRRLTLWIALAILFALVAIVAVGGLIYDMKYSSDFGWVLYRHLLNLLQ